MNVYLVHGMGWLSDRRFVLGVFSTPEAAQATVSAARSGLPLPQWEEGVYNVGVVPLSLDEAVAVCIDPPRREEEP